MNMQIAVKDVFEGFKNYEFWTIFGANEIKKKYRRSKLGQLWITLSVAFFVLIVGSLYKSLFGIEDNSYVTYLAIGYVLWQFISGVLNKSGSIFSKNGKFMLQRSWPTTTFVLWLIYSEILILAHNLLILIPIFFFWGTWPSIVGVLFSILGFLITFMTALAVGMIIGITTLRYRDIQPILKSLVRIAFFATPIIWMERDLGEVGDLILAVNPFGYFLHIVRDPLLGVAINPFDWLIACGIFVVCVLGALLLLARTKHRLAYWL